MTGSRRGALVGELGRLVRFGLVGVSNTAIGLGAYALLLHAGMPYLPAGAIAWCLGTLNGYQWNRLWTFRRASHRTVMLGRYLLVGLVGLVLNSGLLALFVQVVGLGEFVAEVVSLPLVAVSTFTLNRVWTFGHHMRLSLAAEAPVGAEADRSSRPPASPGTAAPRAAPADADPPEPAPREGSR